MTYITSPEAFSLGRLNLLSSSVMGEVDGTRFWTLAHLRGSTSSLTREAGSSLAKEPFYNVKCLDP